VFNKELLPRVCFGHAGPLRNEGNSKAAGTETRGQLSSYFFASVKIKGEMGDMSELVSLCLTGVRRRDREQLV